MRGFARPRRMTLLCRGLELATRPAAMAVSAALSAWWVIEVGTRAGLLDAIISDDALAGSEKGQGT